MSYNVLAVLQAAIEAEHQIQVSELQISSYYIANEVRASYAGMMIALPAPFWEKLDEQSDAQLSRTLLQVAARVDPRKLRKHPRAPKKKTKKGYVSRKDASKHVSAQRLAAS